MRLAWLLLLLPKWALAAFVFGACGTFTADPGGDADLLLPYPTTSVGRLLVACAGARDASTAFADPSGFTSLQTADDARAECWGKVSTGSESGNLTVSRNAGAGDIFVGQVCSFTTSATGWTLTKHAGAGGGFTAAVDSEIPAVTISEASTAVITFAIANVNITPYTSPPTNFTQSGEGGDTGAFVAGAMGYWIQTTATNVGSGTKFDSASGTAVNTHSLTVSISMPTPDPMSIVSMSRFREGR